MLRRQKKKGIKDRKLGPPLLRRIILPAVLLPYQPPKVLNVNHLLLQLRDLKDPEDDYGSEEEDEDEEDGEGEGEGEEDDEGEGEGGGKAALVKVSTGPKVFPKAYRVGDEDPPPEEGEEDEEEEEEEEGPSPEELRAAYLKKLAALMLDIYKFTLKYIHFDEACATLQVAVTYPTNIEDGPNMRATVIRMQIQKGAFEHAYNNLEGIIRDYPRDVAVVSSLLTAAALSRRMGFYDRAAEQIRWDAMHMLCACVHVEAWASPVSCPCAAAQCHPIPLRPLLIACVCRQQALQAGCQPSRTLHPRGVRV